MDDREFLELLTACTELAELFADGLVFIGGIAVYLHAKNTPAVAMYAETTHDADFYISLADMGDLRDVEELTPNRRLSKHQLVKRGFEFDIYTERQSTLIVPYDSVAAHAVRYAPFLAAGLEHLFVLKLEAFRDRRQSAKGEKDARDLLRIAAVAAAHARGFDASLAAPYIRDEHLELLEQVYKSPVAAAMAQGNAVAAKRLRQAFHAIAEPIRRAYSSTHA